MRKKLPLFSALLSLLTVEASAQANLDWASGIGMRLCSSLSEVNESELENWVRGYWTGANLYIGGGDLCTERADLKHVSTNDIKSQITVHCSSIPDSPIMMAAFNALNGLPKVPGSRAAKCGG